MMDQPYDSTPDTQAHIDRVAQLLTLASEELVRRGKAHDASKLVSPEKEGYDTLVPKLRGAVFASLEYKRVMVDMKDVIDHHVKHNSHHPGFYPGGVNDFDLFDLAEMFFDWVAASERQESGSILDSIEVKRRDDTISDQVARIFYNTSQRYAEMLKKTE